MNNYYIINNETLKLELHFDKSAYIALDEVQKQQIKSNFLFSRTAGAWVSRCKFPRLHHVIDIAEKLGLENAGSTGEMLSFEKQQEIKAEKAERRAERYDSKSVAALKEADRLQAPINSMRGDIAFFTQPNINSSAGRAFTRKRNRMFDAWEKGFEYFRKSEYYEQAAATARNNAKAPTDKGFCDRRIKDAEKAIRDQKKNILHYQTQLSRLDAGEVIKRYNGELLTADIVNSWIDEAETIIEMNISKAAYYHKCIDELGGICFSKENIKKGQIIRVNTWGNVKVFKANTTTVECEFLQPHMTYADGSPMHTKVTYADITAITKDA